MSLGSVGRVSRAAVTIAATLLAMGSPLLAQDPIPRDTLPQNGDTLTVPIPPERVVPDTIPVDTVADTILPAPLLPEAPRPPVPGWSGAEWEWDAEDLARWHGLSVVEMIERLPGVVVTRGGWAGQPTGVSAFGQGGGRLRVFLDGYELDPLAAASFDVQQLAVVDLQGVRVRRGLLETRVELHTFRLVERRPFSQVEASTGLYGTRFIRGLFSTIAGEEGMLTLGIDVTDTSGWLGQQPFSANGLLGRYSRLFGPDTGLEVEFRQTSLARPVGTAYPIDAERRDLVLRGRHQINPRLLLRADFGHSSRSNEVPDTLGSELTAIQGHVRGVYDLGAGWLAAGARLRDRGDDRFAAPRVELEVDGGSTLGELMRFSAAVRSRSAQGITGTELEGRVEAGPIAGFTIFAEAAGGSRGIGTVRDTLVEVPVLGEDGEPALREEVRPLFSAVRANARGFRGGVEWRWAGARAGAALIRQDEGTIAPFGLPFDRWIPAVSAPAITGFEASVSVPLGTPALRLEGWHTGWSEVAGRPYLPRSMSSGALIFSRTFYEGNLEPTLRVEGFRRGAAVTPGLDADAFDAVAAPYTWGNFFLQIRILDVRAFFIWENMTADDVAADLPGRVRGGARSYYGVRWHFLD